MFPLMCTTPYLYFSLLMSFVVFIDREDLHRPALPSRRPIVFFPCPPQTEGIALAQAADLPADKLLTVLDQGAMSNPMFRMKVRD